jgi:hypothetical protein
MALAQLNIQQKGQPTKQVKVRRLSGDKRFGMAVTSADGSAYRQSLTIYRVSNPDMLRKLNADIRKRPTVFSFAVNGKSYAVRSELIGITSQIRLHFGDDTVAILNPGDDSDVQSSPFILVLVGIYLISDDVAAIVYAAVVASEEGSSDVEGEAGDREDGGEGDGEGGGSEEGGGGEGE